MTNRMLRFTFVILLLATGCKVGPNYSRPAATIPDAHRGAPPSIDPKAGTFADTKWESVFTDEALRYLIREALANNFDIKIAAARVAQAQAIAGITKADQLPSVSASAGVVNQRIPPVRGDQTIQSAFVQVSYIADFWGQYRRASEAARANLVASRYGEAVVRTSLISQVASTYFRLRQLDSQLEFANKSVEAFKEILRINTIKFQGRESSKSEVLQAEVLLQQAEAAVIALSQQIEQTENQISILLGRNPGPIPRGLQLSQQDHLSVVPPGLPSALLERRPDVLQSEQLLVAANANVGVAKAAFFPQIALTGAFGAQSTSLASFLEGPATTWALGAQVLQPVYQGGRIRSNYRLAWARRDEAELFYRRTVEHAFGDVANSLVGYEQSRKYRAKLEEQSASYKEAARLANVRFQGGYTAFLEVLITEQQYFTSELDAAQAWDTELQNYVQLYQALGGGWDR